MAYPMASKTSKPAASSGGNLGVAGGKKSSADGSWLKGLVTLIVILIIIGGGVYLISSYTGIGSSFFNGTSGLKSDWQAVFLTNGQVYFGEVTKMNNDVVILKDIYYLQVVTQPLQRSQQGEEATQETEQRLTLVKLGNEIHGPQDEMTINRDHVIIVEDLKDDSRVVQAINDYVAAQ